MKAILLLIVSLSNIIIISNESLNCNGETIDHCQQCNTGENSDSCAKCEDKYFLFFHNLLCLPCDDPIYGQIGCDGNCDSSNYAQTRFPLCKEGKCKEGFSYINGICFKCSISSPGCANCSYVVEEYQTIGEFICHSCLSNEYKLSEFGTCEHCNLSLSNCEKCHFNDMRAECDKCIDGYYRDSNGYCKKCYTSYFHNRECLVCTDNETDYEGRTCRCNSGYYLSENYECEYCPYGCSNCEFNKITKNVECLNCYTEYELSPNKTCIYCGEGCEYCELDENLTPICLSCYSNIFIVEKYKCLPCSRGCHRCTHDPSSILPNETICTQCYYNWGLHPEKICYQCSELKDTGGYGCYTCAYNTAESKFDCLTCNNNNYAYINNVHQCLPNYDQDDLYLYGCLEANYVHQTSRYECLKCKENFTKIINDNTCRITNFSVGCQEVINLGSIENPLYSCNKCEENYAIVNFTSIGFKDCFYRRYYPNFFYCLEGEIDQYGTKTCITCVDHASLNSSGICECNSDSFGQNNSLCYECDDKSKGNPGCLASKGCNYFHSNDELDCNECKDGYFNYTRGQCFPCNNEISNCEKCHFDSKLICDKCANFYLLNDTENECLLNECEEYPEIAPGCIICKDKLKEYYSQNKCQHCKYGYFKTKEESCVLCKSEEYGGPSCFECGYEIAQNGSETDNIICKDCFSIDQYKTYDNSYNYYNTYNRHSFSNSALSSKGKCYNCQSRLTESCLKCQFKKDEKGEKLVCIMCAVGYYLDSEGKCVSFLDKLQILPNCDEHSFNIGQLRFYFYEDEENIYINSYYYSGNDLYFSNYNEYNEIVKNATYPIATTCTYCKSGYYFINNGICEKINITQCNGNFIKQNTNIYMNACRNLCYNNGYPFIYLNLKNGTLDYDAKEYSDDYTENNFVSILSILYNLNLYNNEIKNVALNNTICLDISDKNLKNKFIGCQEVAYIPKIKDYQCISCNYEYEMDIKKYICKKNIITDKEGMNCELEIIGPKSSPLYSCKSCYGNEQTMVIYENGAKACIDKYKLYGCTEATANTEYINPVYNCTSCIPNYIPYYSKFFGRKICQSILENITKQIDLDQLSLENSESFNTTNGICPRNIYFTPDNKKCYSCNDEKANITGCKDTCSFSLYRKDTIKCENGCKDGYIETSEGICESCESVNEGCLNCDYSSTYPSNYIGIKKKRRFVCQICKPNYHLINGKCLKCSDLGFRNCDECIKDEISENYVCTKCSKYYWLNENGSCGKCVVTKAELNNKCIQCGDSQQGGIEGCYYCLTNEKGSGITCKQCTDNYILLSDDNKCKKRDEQYKKFDSCLELKIKNGNYVCSKCKLRYSLIEIDGELKCIETPTLYDQDFNVYYYYKLNSNNEYKGKNLINNYSYKQNFFYPCKESINLGTKANPRYSCNKCYNVFDNEEFDNIYYNDYDDYYKYFYYNYYDDYYYDYYYFEDEYYLIYGHPIKITEIIEKGENINYCMVPNQDTKNCLEATYKIENGKEIYDCQKCNDKYILKYNKNLTINYCAENKNTAIRCMVNFCKNCMSDNYYFCSSCITSDYEVNKITGSCVKKMEVIPTVTWKDIFRLVMNVEKVINGKTISGPSLILRGITSSQINSRHAFLIYLTFKIKYSLRNLQAVKIITTYCEIKESVEESKDDINLIDYECIGDSDVELDNKTYELIGIEEGDNDGVIISNSFDDIVKNTNLTNLERKNNPDFTIKDLENIIKLIVDENYINNQTSSNNTFNFSLYGRLNKNLESRKFKDLELKLRGIENETAKCDFNSEDNSNASLICGLELKSDYEIKNFSFKTDELDLKYKEKKLYVPSLNEIYLLKTEEEISRERKRARINHNTLIAVLSIVVGALALAGIGIVLYIILKPTRVIPVDIINTNNIAETSTKKINRSDANLNK